MTLSKIQAESITDGSITAPKVVSGMPVNYERVLIPPKTFSPTTLNAIPRDNTVPQISEGASYFQHNYTPKLTNSTIVVTASMHIGETLNTINVFASALFFNDSCVNVRATNSSAGNGDRGQHELSGTFSNTDGSVLDIEIRGDEYYKISLNSQLLSTGSSQNYTDASSCFGGTDSINGSCLTIVEIK